MKGAWPFIYLIQDYLDKICTQESRLLARIVLRVRNGVLKGKILNKSKIFKLINFFFGSDSLRRGDLVRACVRPVPQISNEF